MHLNDECAVFTMQLFALFIRCPLREETCRCPFAPIRNMKCLSLKFRLAERMADTPRNAREIWDIHNFCYQKRLAGFREQARLKDLPSAGETPC